MADHKLTDLPYRDPRAEGWVELDKQLDRLVKAARAWASAFDPLSRFRGGPFVVAAILALTACGESVPIRVYTSKDTYARVRDAVELAAEAGLPVHVTDGDGLQMAGVPRLRSPDGNAGWTSWGARCHSFVVFRDDGNDHRIVHELGHVFGLDHSDDPDNYMFKDGRFNPNGYHLTVQQIEDAERVAGRLAACDWPSFPEVDDG